MKPILIALFLCLVWKQCFARSVEDSQIEFSVSVPDASKVEVASNEQGRSVTIVYQDTASSEVLTVQAVRANNGGFNTSQASFFAGMLAGLSDRIGKKPSAVPRTLSYLDRKLYIAQHAGVGSNPTQALTTVVFMQERGSWRKVITVQFLSNGVEVPSDKYILEKLRGIQFRPAT